VQLVDIILDNRISCSFIDDSGVENVIFCRPLEESLDNVSLIATKDNEFIHNYLEESTGKYLETSVILNDGAIYEGVRFKLVTIEEGKELPASTVNLSSLGVPSATDVLPPVRLIEEDYNTTLENIEEEDDFSILYDVPEAIDNSGIVKKVKALETKLVTEQQKLEQEKIKLNKERVILENERRLSKALEDYKAELLQETFLVSNHQKELLEKSIQDLSNSFQEQFDGQQINVEKYLDTLSSANLEEVKKYQDSQVDRIKDQINTLISERQEKNTLTTDKLLLERTSELESIFTEKLITELEDHKRNVKIEIDGINNALDKLIGEKLKENNDNVDQLLVSRAGVLQEQFNDKLTKDLIEHKDSLFNEFKTVSTETASTLFTEKTEELNSALTIVLNEHRQNLDNTVTGKLNEISSTVNTFKTEIDGKLPQLDETIKDINKRIQTLVIEKKNVQLLVDDAKKYTDTKVAQVSEEVMNYARRILDLGGGGGSNAVQYANGGTMKGSLNVTGQYLSGGIDISTLFGKGGGGTSTAQSIYVSGGAIGSIQPLSGSNTASGYYSNIGGGSCNTASGAYSFIGGGCHNITVSNCYSCVDYASIISGENNIISSNSNNVSRPGFANHSIIVGGKNNVMCAVGEGFFEQSYVTYSNIAGGYGNVMCSPNGGEDISYSNIAGGCVNVMHGSASYSNILGGQSNIITSCGCSYSTVTHVSIVGGHNNIICSNTGSAYYFSSVVTANIAGGCNNKIISSGGGSIGNSNIAGGTNNTVSAGYRASVGNSNIAGGCNNTVSAYANSVDNSGIASGLHNTISSFYAFIKNSGIASGKNNTICACGSIGNYGFGYGICSSNIAGGESNSICSCYYNEVRYASIAGGSNNTITGSGSYSNPGCCTFHSSIAGGYNNLICSASCSFIGGGDTNCTTSVLAVVVGGNHNCATGGTSFVGGGRVNTSSAQYSTVVGGNQNSSTGYAAFVGGGYNNNASGEYSSIIGGASNDTNSQANTFILGSSITAPQSGYTYVNNLSSQGTIAAANIKINTAPSTFINPVTASGTFLIVNINGTNKALQLWDYSS